MMFYFIYIYISVCACVIKLIIFYREAIVHDSIHSHPFGGLIITRLNKNH